MLCGIHETYYKSNVLTPNEIREKLGREPSDSQWANAHYADVEIAKVAARGVAQDLDADLPSGGTKKPADNGKDKEGRSQRGRSFKKTQRDNSTD